MIKGGVATAEVCREEVMVMLGIGRENESKRMQNTLRLAVCSDLRRNLLICLKEGKKALSELRVELEVSSTTAIHALRELEKNTLVFQDVDRGYALTKIGEIVALKLSDFVDAIEVLKKHERFWLEHDLSGIPEHLLEKIGWLKDSTVIKNTATDLFKVHSTFVNLLKGAKKVRGVSSIFLPEFSTLFKGLIMGKKVDVQLLVTKEVLDEIDHRILREIFSNEGSKFKLYLTKENAPPAFTVTDYCLSFGLFHLDGSYDYNEDLVSCDKKATAWGWELFEWYRKRAEGIQFRNL